MRIVTEVIAGIAVVLVMAFVVGEIAAQLGITNLATYTFLGVNLGSWLGILLTVTISAVLLGVILGSFGARR